MIHHSAVSLDYLEAHPADELLVSSNGKPMHVFLTLKRLVEWRSQGYTYAPPCDNVTTDGKCAGHEKEALR